MDSPHGVVSALRSSPVIVEKRQTNFFVLNSQVMDTSGRDRAGGNQESPIGSLEVYIHQARDIHNICIYQKQDVYAKLCLTSDPDNAVSTKIVNGGGRNPVFNENVHLKVRNLECSLKCEVWMLSRVRNYLEDQLLGFALVPLSEVLLKNGKLQKEFSLSSTDLFHSPAGFVQLSLFYNGTSPEVLAVPAPMPSALATDIPIEESEATERVLCELEKIEFPDPKIVNENQIMMSEYFGLPCDGLDSDSCEKLVASDNETLLNSEMGVQVVECLAAAAIEPVQQQNALDSPQSTSSSNVISFPSVQASSQSSDAPVVSKYLGQEQLSKSPTGVEISSTKNLVEDHETDSTSKPVISVKVPEQKVVQQEIVDMYMKSMQQFTESLAKMKLPLDIETETTSLGESSPDQGPDSARNSGSRVFYGSRAFF